MLLAMVLAKPEVTRVINKQGATVPSLIEDKDLAEVVASATESRKRSGFSLFAKAGCGEGPGM
jgi:hypothetical protein